MQGAIVAQYISGEFPAPLLEAPVALTACTYIDRDEVLQGLAHLKTFDMKMTGMDKVVDP